MSRLGRVHIVFRGQVTTGSCSLPTTTRCATSYDCCDRFEGDQVVNTGYAYNRRLRAAAGAGMEAATIKTTSLAFHMSRISWPAAAGVRSSRQRSPIYMCYSLDQMDKLRHKNKQMISLDRLLEPRLDSIQQLQLYCLYSQKGDISIRDEIRQHLTIG